MIDAVREAGGRAILAHPAWSLLRVADARPLRGLAGAEIFNSVSRPPWNADRADSRMFFDLMSAEGAHLNCVAADDSHYYQGEHCRAFIMVNAREYYLLYEFQKAQPVSVPRELDNRIEALPIQEFQSLVDELTLLNGLLLLKRRWGDNVCPPVEGNALTLRDYHDPLDDAHSFMVESLKARVVILSNTQEERRYCLRILGHAQLLCQLGMPLPARHAALPLCQGLYTHFPKSETYEVNQHVKEPTFQAAKSGFLFSGNRQREVVRRKARKWPKKQRDSQRQRASFWLSKKDW